MDNSRVNKWTPHGGCSTSSGRGIRFATNAGQQIPLIRGGPTVKVNSHFNPQEQNRQVRSILYNHKSSERSAASFVRNSSVANCNGRLYRAVLLPRTNFSDQGNSDVPLLLPQQSSASIPRNLRKVSVPKNSICIRGTAGRPVAVKVATSLPPVILNSTNAADSPSTVRASSHSQVGNLSNSSLSSTPTKSPVRYGCLTSDGEHVICHNCGCCIHLPNGTFSKFAMHLEKNCLDNRNAENYEAPPSVAPKFNPTAQSRAPVATVAPPPPQGNCSDQSGAAPPKKLAKASESTARQVDWTRYGVHSDFNGLIVCKLCGEDSFPFICIDGFRKHLEVFHSSEIQ
ncbi:hypothetical protein D918_04833 [Trichuris suis]|nr:hypothetical protein D918_04833 [Trichuris suis]